MLQELADRVWAHSRFQNEYLRLTVRGLRAQLQLAQSADGLGEAELLRLLQSAVNFAGTDDPIKREAAYRIAISCWALFGEQYGTELRELVHIVLARLGNFPAVGLLFRDASEETGSRLGSSLWLEMNARRMGNEVAVDESTTLALTDFQRRLWVTLVAGNSACITAPTSAGKSFALQRFLAGKLAARQPFVGLYIVPTRALIHQVSTALKEAVRSLTHDDVPVLTIPVAPSEHGITRALYVLTQERLQILLETENPAFALIVVDEAQTIAADSRGILLDTVLERIVASNPNAQVLFISPTVSNPEMFQKAFPMGSVARVDETETPVAQNLIFIETDPVRRDRVAVYTRTPERTRVGLGTVDTGVQLFDPKQTIACLSHFFGRNDQSLVYAGSPAACEEVAAKIADLRALATGGQADDEHSSLKELSQFLRDHIHPQYLLASTVKHGVAFHYGQMPAVVRKALEDYFDEGLLRCLVSTSTLLHGVNLPAKNLFLLDPTKGGEWPSANAEAVTPSEFWNLAGRAGRLTREFEGNVFVINPSGWRARPFDEDKRQPITSALDDQLRAHQAELVSFIRDENHASGKEQVLESAFVRLFNDFHRGKLGGRLDRIFGVDSEAGAEVLQTLAAAAARVTVPQAILERHVAVSVHRQQGMLDFLLTSVRRDGPEAYIPAHPRSAGAHTSLLRLFKCIHTHFECRPDADRSQAYYAPLALRWMRGDPLSRMIAHAYKYKSRSAKRGPPAVGPVIRSLMSDIEQDLCFRYVKYTRCYLDLLGETLRRTGNEHFCDRIPSIALYLELGASSGTMVSLIGLGLSRTTAGILAEHAADRMMDSPTTQAWMRRQNFAALGVPGPCVREIERLFA